ncbi:MAG TPA: hypothetical protein VGM94_08585 [Galbitalea sp.]|jgi:hypothetical protein
MTSSLVAWEPATPAATTALVYLAFTIPATIAVVLAPAVILILQNLGS